MENIILIGMPGCGKSTLGVVLAKAMGYGFIDTDLIISHRAKTQLQKIIDSQGLEAFLELEQSVGAELECERTIVATGGSMVLSDKAMQNLKRLGRVVYINVPLDEIKRRVTNLKTRGIACHRGETLDDVFNKRTPLYEKYADVTIDFISVSDIESTVERLVDILHKD